MSNPPTFTFPLRTNVNYAHPFVQAIELFVGNLSYFCNEEELCDLFNQYGTVVHARIIRSDDKTRSLMYGFVLMATKQEMDGISQLLNGHLFMGRHLR